MKTQKKLFRKFKSGDLSFMKLKKIIYSLLLFIFYKKCFRIDNNA